MRHPLFTTILSLSFLFCAASWSTSWAEELPPLFAGMRGDWVGEGEKMFPAIGQRVLIEAEAHAEVENGKLVSRNRIVETTLSIETQQPTGTKTYDRVYWIRPAVDGTPDAFELGYGELDQVSSRGNWVNGAFEVEQDLGGFLIKSVTEFGTGSNGDETLYRETTWYGGNVNTQTLIRYRPR